MQDCLPPSGWGPAPFDERDLDAVLAGETIDVPLALRPVAEALAALRVGAAPAELRGEANAMAEFRALYRGRGQAAHPAGLARTMLLEALPADTARPRSARRRGRRRAPRRAPRRASWRAGALTAVAAAAVVVAAVLFTGNLPGPIEALAHMAHLPTTSPSATGSTGHSAPPKTEVTSAAVEPTSHPAVTHSSAPAQPSPSSACRTYFAYFKHPVPPSDWPAVMSLWQRLTKLAGSQNPHQVYQYCARYVSDLFPHWAPVMGQYPPAAHPAPGGAGTGSTGAGNQGSAHPGQQSNGAVGTQNGSGSNPGAGSPG